MVRERFENGSTMVREWKEKENKTTKKMAEEIMTYGKEKNVVVYRSADNAVQLDVQLAEETVWLTQKQMTDLFQKDQSVIARHINNIFAEGELDKSNMQILHNTQFKYRPTGMRGNHRKYLEI